MFSLYMFIRVQQSHSINLVIPVLKGVHNIIYLETSLICNMFLTFLQALKFLHDKGIPYGKYLIIVCMLWFKFRNQFNVLFFKR